MVCDKRYLAIVALTEFDERTQLSVFQNVKSVIGCVNKRRCGVNFTATKYHKIKIHRNNEFYVFYIK